MQNPCKISPLCRNKELYLKFSRIFDKNLLFARTLQDMYCLRESFKTSISCKNLSRWLLFARKTQDIYYLQESLNISNICKNFARYLFFCKNLIDYLLSERILQGISCLQRNSRIRFFWNNLASYLIFARALPNISYLQIISKTFFSAWTSQIVWIFHEPCKIPLICKKVPSYLFPARISQII